VQGLVVQYALFNMATTTAPNRPTYLDIVGTIGLWLDGEMKTYPAGRLLTPRFRIPGRAEELAPPANLALKVYDDRVSFNMPFTIPVSGRKAAIDLKEGRTNILGPLTNFGPLHLRVRGSDRCLATIAPEVYTSWPEYYRTSGIIDVSIDWGKDAALRDEVARAGLYLEGGDPSRRTTLLEEVQEVVQTDRTHLYIEHPDSRREQFFDECVEVRSFIRGEPAPLREVRCSSYYNPRGFPHLKLAFESDPANAGRAFAFPTNDELRLVTMKPGRPDEAGEFQGRCSVATDARGRAWLTVRGVRAGVARVLLAPAKTTAAAMTPPAAEEATFYYDNEDRLRFWSSAGSLGVRVLPNDWHLADVQDDEVDFAFLYRHVLQYYELIYPFMNREIFSLQDESKCETYAALMWQMCDPIHKDKTYYMPPTRDLSLPKAELFRKYLRKVSRQSPVSAEPVAAPAALPAAGIDTREQLMRALRDAVELETGLMLQYLYAGLSLPNHVTGEAYVRQGLWTPEQLQLVCGDGQQRRAQGWRGMILEVAHEEMIHFLIANNLLMAVGGSFHAPAPRFSHVARYYPIDVEMALEPFGPAAVRRFVQFEWPSYFREDRPHTGARLANDSADAGHATDYCSVSDLYGHIRRAFERHPDFIVVEKNRTGGEHHLFLNEYINHRHPAYQCQVDDLDSALFAIQIITEQGEGISPQSPQFETSHFQRFRVIERQLTEQINRCYDRDFTRPLWNPAYPALKNPTLERGGRGNLVTDLEARQTMQLFNGAYEMMLQLMVQHFGGPISSLRKSKLMNTSIDVMTGLMRPLAILLMTMDSGRPGRTAGPSFELDEPVNYIPKPNAAGRAMGLKFRDLLKLANDLPKVGDAVRGVLQTMIRFCESLGSKS
jgi:hypothetical protein